MIRLNKFLAERLGLSRRQADDAIAAGKVTVNGEVARLGDRLEALDSLPKVCYNGKIVPFVANFTYLGMNKPAGYVCSRRRQGETPTIFELLPKKYQSLKTVGRLDKDSSGLILLTNDGDFAFQMTHPKFIKTKIYQVELDHPLEPLHQQMIADFGVELVDGTSKLGLVRLEKSQNVNMRQDAEMLDDGGLSPDGSRKFWRVEMREGRNRQIRRTFGALGYTVVKLHRTDFGKYHLNGLKLGEFTEVKKQV